MTNEMPRHYFLRKSGFLKVFLLAFSFFSFSILSALHARPGDLDLSFGGEGTLINRFNPSNFDAAYTVSIQDNSNKILVGGYSVSLDYLGYPNRLEYTLARYQTNGTLDPTFGINGVVKTDMDLEFGDPVNAFLSLRMSLRQQRDGKIILAGFSGQISYLRNLGMVRYTADGVLDSSFGEDGRRIVDFGSHDRFTEMFLDSSDRILLVGDEYNRLGVEVKVDRFLPAGDLDNTFGDNGRFIFPLLDSRWSGDHTFSGLRSADLSSDGQLTMLIGAGWSYESFLRIDRDGNLDRSFGDLGRVLVRPSNCHISKIRYLNDGHILGIGQSNLITDGQTYHRVCVKRFNSNGSLDSTFAEDGTSVVEFPDVAEGNNYNAYPEDFLVLPNNKIIMGGMIGGGYTLHGDIHIHRGFDFLLSRFLPNGRLDSAFGRGGYVKTRLRPITNINAWDVIFSITFDSHCRVLAVGDSAQSVEYTGDFGLARFENDGCFSEIPGVTSGGVVSSTTLAVDPCRDPQSLYLDGQDCGARELTVPVTDIPPVPDPVKDYTAPSPDMYEQKTESSWDWNSVWDAFQK